MSFLRNEEAVLFQDAPSGFRKQKGAEVPGRLRIFQDNAA